MRHIINYGRIAFFVNAGTDPKPLLDALAAARRVIYQHSTHSPSGRRVKLVLEKKEPLSLDAVGELDLSVVDRDVLDACPTTLEGDQ